MTDRPTSSPPSTLHPQTRFTYYFLILTLFRLFSTCTVYEREKLRYVDVLVRPKRISPTSQVLPSLPLVRSIFKKTTGLRQAKSDNRHV